MGPAEDATKDEHQPDYGHIQRVIVAMRLMLIAVSIAAIAAVGVAIFLYEKTIPEIHTLRTALDAEKTQNDATKAENEKTRSQLADNCENMSTREKDSYKDFQGAVQTLNLCMDYFKDDPSLPAYKAEVLASGFAHGKGNGSDLDGAIQAATQSLAIRPTTEAYEWKGYAYCLKAKSAKPADRTDLLDKAAGAFEEEFKSFPKRKDTLQRSESFGTLCPAELQKRLYP